VSIILRDKLDPHPPASIGPNQPAKLLQRQFVIVNAHDQLHLFIIENLAPQSPSEKAGP
jgi:hypothetical protein